MGYTGPFGFACDVCLIKADAWGNEQWFHTFGGSDNDYGFSVQQTSDGGYIIAGYTSSFYPWDWNVYLIKTDASGNEQWHRTFDNYYCDYGYCVDKTSDGGYIIVGSTNSPDTTTTDYSDVYLIKTDSLENEEWHQTFDNSSDDYGKSVQQTSDGGYIIAGSSGSSGAGWYDVYLIKTDSFGNEQWEQTFGGNN